MHYAINWKGEFDALRPYLVSIGGVVHVRHRGLHGAPSALLSRLKHEFSNLSSKPSSVLVIDEDNWSARYTNDIVARLAEKIAHQIPAPSDGNLNSRVASNNNALGDIIINASTQSGNGARGSPHAIDKLALQGTIAALEKFVQENRLLIVIFNGNDDVNGPFWRDLWAPHISKYNNGNILLVKFCDITKSAAPDQNEPIADLDLLLPSEVTLATRDSFVADMVSIYVQEASVRGKQVSEADARKIVDVVVWSRRESIGELLAAWPSALMNAVQNA